MAHFYIDFSSSASYYDQWRQHLQKEAYIGDIETAIKNQTDKYNNLINAQTEVQLNGLTNSIIETSNTLIKATAQQAEHVANEINYASQEQIDAIRQQTVQLIGSIESMSSQISDEISHLGFMVGTNFSILIDELRISNLLSKNIAELLRIPDFQKERIYYIEQGLKHYINAKLDQDLYKDALENLLEAEKREKTDYTVLYRIGMIYLYSPASLDLEKAENYFRRSAKYSIVENDPKAIRLINILAGDTSKDLKSQNISSNSIKSIAADSYFQTGFSCYVQGKFDEAIILFEKSIKLNPLYLEANLNLARCLVQTNQQEKAARILRPAIENKPIYSTIVANDRVLSNANTVMSLLLLLTENACNDLSSKFNLLETTFPDLKDSNDGDIEKDFSQIKRVIKNGQYLPALDMIKRIPDIEKRLTIFREHKTIIEKIKKTRLSKNDFSTFWSGKLETIEKQLKANQYFQHNLDNYPPLFTAGLKDNQTDFTSLKRLSISPNGKWIAARLTVDYDSTIQLWDVDRKTCVNKLSVRLNSPVHFSYDSELLIYTSPHDQKAITLWDIATNTKITTFGDVIQSALYFSSDSKWAVSIRETIDKVSLWDIEKQSLITTLFVKDLSCDGYGNDVLLSPNKQWLVIPSTRGNELYDVAKNECIMTQLTNSWLHNICFKPDSSIVAFASIENKNTVIWDVKKRTSITTIDSYLGNLCFSPNGKLLAGLKIQSHTSASAGIELWDLVNHNCIYECDKSIYQHTISFSPDSNILSFSAGDEIIFLDITNKDYTKTIKTNKEYSPIRHCFSSDWQRMACENTDGSIDVWELGLSIESEIKNIISIKEKQQFEKDKIQEEMEIEKKRTAEDLFQKGKEEENIQDKKWFSKNYDKALSFYQQAYNLGLKEAKIALEKLKSKL